MPLDLKGNKYWQVKERLPKFAEMFPDYRVTSEVVSADDHQVIMKVSILNKNGDVMSTGHAQGIHTGREKILEKTESVACGRALAFLHPELMGNEIASADEIAEWVQHGNDVALLKHMEMVREHWQSIWNIKTDLYWSEREDADESCTRQERLSRALEAWRELGEDVMRILWRAPSKGGVFTTRERKLLDEAATEDHKARKVSA